MRRLHATPSTPDPRWLIVLPCVESPSEETSDAALERLAQERDRLSAHIDELIRTRDALDQLMVVNRAHRATL
ncbi:hypothetical protein [Nocardia carnea]|uniref:hypothetical protein n=1 Tax=Nocardia carnea TaxID=37328 RepID=UPI002457FE3B|nr:hypothetical protein [Nocardia carnea]